MTTDGGVLLSKNHTIFVEHSGDVCSLQIIFDFLVTYLFAACWHNQFWSVTRPLFSEENRSG